MYSGETKLLLLYDNILNIYARFDKLSIKYSHGFSNVAAFILLIFIYSTIHHESKTSSNFESSGFVVNTSSSLTLLYINQFLKDTHASKHSNFPMRKMYKTLKSIQQFVGIINYIIINCINF
jgi:hypothetical protein